MVTRRLKRKKPRKKKPPKKLREVTKKLIRNSINLKKKTNLPQLKLIA
jgi:hypothetical protein